VKMSNRVRQQESAAPGSLAFGRSGHAVTGSLDGIAP
jgi:hypothetical protein